MKVRLKQFSKGTTKKGDLYIYGTFDNEGVKNIQFKIWNAKEEHFNSICETKSIEILAMKESEYNGKPQVDIQQYAIIDEIPLPPREDVFKEEKLLIKNEKILEFLNICLDNVPDYFFDIPASSTGKYHPEFTLGDGGLVRHTKAAVMFADEMFRNKVFGSFSSDERDCMLVAIILHDTFKNGVKGSPYTVQDHPIQAANFVDAMAKKNGGENKFTKLISHCIYTHMGEWGKSKTGAEITPEPRTIHQKFVHIADYMASRKFIQIKFDN